MNKYTPRQQQIFDDYLITHNGRLTAQRLNITHARVFYVLRLFGYKKPRKPLLSDEEKTNKKLERQISLFWTHVDKRSDNECWEWNVGKTKAGYGHLNSKIMPDYYAHRIAWILTHGKIPDNLNVLHTCDNRGCCNPNHLYLGTQKDNCKDRTERFYKNGLVPALKKYR